MALGTLVLAYPPFVPLSHLSFELTTDAVVNVLRTVLLGLWLGAVVRLVRRLAHRHRRDHRPAGDAGDCDVRGIVGVAVSRFEPGTATPTATATPL